MVRIVSWNVNGIRAAEKKGFLNWVYKDQADIISLQETKAHPEQLSKELLEIPGYHAHWHSAEKKGYSGVVTYCKEEPLHVSTSIGKELFDREGRVVRTDYKKFTLFNVYFPNGKMNSDRLKYKLDFYDHFLKHINKLKDEGKKIIVTGDFNTAHHAIDLARPKENETISGFLPIERAWMDKLVKHGYHDAFREFTKEGEHYTWWSMRTRARERNVGWRIDYHFLTKNLLPKLKEAIIHRDVYGSDHCPISITLDF